MGKFALPDCISIQVSHPNVIVPEVVVELLSAGTTHHECQDCGNHQKGLIISWRSMQNCLIDGLREKCCNSCCGNWYRVSGSSTSPTPIERVGTRGRTRLWGQNHGARSAGLTKTRYFMGADTSQLQKAITIRRMTSVNAAAHVRLFS
jgi:hypothetical protein